MCPCQNCLTLYEIVWLFSEILKFELIHTFYLHKPTILLMILYIWFVFMRFDFCYIIEENFWNARSKNAENACIYWRYRTFRNVHFDFFLLLYTKNAVYWLWQIFDISYQIFIIYIILNPLYTNYRRVKHVISDLVLVRLLVGSQLRCWIW